MTPLHVRVRLPLARAVPLIRPIARLLALLTGIVGVAVLTTTPSAASPRAAAQDDAASVHDIVFPVVGPVEYSDTFGACRGTGCHRSHKGVDIFGHKLAPLVAAADGTISGLRRSSLSNAGNTVIIDGDDGWRYLYLHVNNDSPGTDDGANPQAWIAPNRLRVGDRVAAGDVVGYLGDSGNAETTPAHLHFEMHRPDGTVINPTPSVAAADAAGREVSMFSLASTPEARAEHAPLIDAWYRALLRREPTPAELFAWADRFAIGFGSRDDLIADLTMAPQRHRPAGAVVRAYHVALGRRPNMVELQLSERLHREGAETHDMVVELLAGDEFEERYGQPSDADFVDIIYRNARGRAPAASVRRYWLGQFTSGRPRIEMATYFADSYGVKDLTWHDLEVMQAFRAALDRLPTDAEFDRWVAHLDGGGLIVDVVDAIKE
ncbi:MAG: DUF4214 domain-containing protein [Acidimicrobiales bacterium]